MRLLAIGVTRGAGAAGALHSAQLALAEGELHALVGAEGAGKSAFLRILGGLVRPTRGLMLLDGQPYAPDSPEAARRVGVWMAGCGETLADGLTVEENLVLGMEPSRRGWIDRSARRAMACRTLAELPGGVIAPEMPVQLLSAAERRGVEIARALLALPKVLLVEEAWPDPSGAFSSILQRLAARGVSVVYATRSPEAARTLCSRYTLLSQGGTIASGRTRGTAPADLALRERSSAQGLEALPRLPRHRGRPLFQAREGVAVHEGEILGIACTGAAPRDRSFDRGILPGLSLADNLTLPCLRRFGALGFFSPARQETVAVDWLAKLRVRARSPRQEASSLSAADRIKLVIGRFLLEKAAVLALEAPTVGLSGAAKGEIHALLQSAAAEGRGIVVFSADPAELLMLCDTVALVHGTQVTECRAAGEWTETELAAAFQASS